MPGGIGCWGGLGGFWGGKHNTGHVRLKTIHFGIFKQMSKL